ncbi:MAG: hypothetical protein ABSE07_05785 [Methanoregula sp.]|jgi:hypothetical protein
MDDFELNITIIGLIISIVGICLAIIIPIIQHFLKQKRNHSKYLIKRNEADKLFSEEKYSEALKIYKEIIENFDTTSIFEFGEIYSHMGQCVIGDPRNNKNYDKLLEGANYFKKSLNYFDLSKSPYKQFIYNLIAFLNDFKIYTKILMFLKIDKHKIFLKILELLGLYKFIFNYAGRKIDLAINYCRLAEVRDSVSYFEMAINELQDSIKIYTFDLFPIDHVIASENLIKAYQNIARFKDPEKYQILVHNLMREIILKTDTKPHLFDGKEGTKGFAMKLIRAGNLCREKYELNPDNQNGYKILQIAIFAYENALAFFDIETYPSEYALIKNNLGIAFMHLATKKDWIRNLEIAKQHLLDALIVTEKDQKSIRYSQTLHNLGLLCAYFSRIETKNERKIYLLNQSMNQYEKALQIRNIVDYPIEYAETQFTFTLALYELSKIENKEENVNKALKHLQESNKIFTKEKYPQKHAKNQYLFELLKK